MPLPSGEKPFRFVMLMLRLLVRWSLVGLLPIAWVVPAVGESDAFLYR